MYDIIKSRTIELSKIKNKEERKYWKELKRINQIPQIFIRTEDIYKDLKYKMKDNHPLINKVSNIKLYVTGNKKARKMLFDMGVGNSTGFGFGFARLNEDNE